MLRVDKISLRISDARHSARLRRNAGE